MALDGLRRNAQSGRHKLITEKVKAPAGPSDEGLVGVLFYLQRLNRPAHAGRACGAYARLCVTRDTKAKSPRHGFYTRQPRHPLSTNAQRGGCRAAIEANLGNEDFTVERLARRVAHSRGHLQHRLRELIDESPPT